MINLIAALTLAGHLAGPTQQLPDVIAIPTLYRSSVDAMLRYSPTFRRQYSRIVRTTSLRVEILPSLLNGRSPDGAVTQLRNDRGIKCRAARLRDPVLHAHKFEHILISSMASFRSMAMRVATGGLVSGSGHFETDRDRAGRQVADEVRRERREGRDAVMTPAGQRLSSVFRGPADDDSSAFLTATQANVDVTGRTADRRRRGGRWPAFTSRSPRPQTQHPLGRGCPRAGRAM